jgi:hypothetical protein
MRTLISGLVVLAVVSACQPHRLPPHKAAKLARTSNTSLPANPIVQKWTLPSGETATLLVRWKPFPPPEGKPTEPGAIAAMELTTATSKCVLPKFAFEQLWAPSLEEIQVISLDGSDSNLLVTIPCGDGGESTVAELHVENGVLKSAWPIDMHTMSDLFPATEPTPQGMRKRVTVTLR